MELDVHIGASHVGVLTYDSATDTFDFAYAASWCENLRSFALSPYIPLPATLAGAHPLPRGEVPRPLAIRRFLENLLPEGRALDAAAASARVSKSNVAGLLALLGKECIGALRIVPRGAPPIPSVSRLLTPAELSTRIQSRFFEPFMIWDGKIRLSLPGYQDKIAVRVKDSQWFLVEGEELASTHIIKPEPSHAELQGLTSHEFFCMRLAKAAGLPTADVQLRRVPEDILIVERFDRRSHDDRVERIHVIDGCQALGLQVSAKYERLYGDGRDVKDIRDGARYEDFFALMRQAPSPTSQRNGLLQWAIFQVLIGNADAHAKNLSFFCGPKGLSLAPAYDQVSTHSMDRSRIASTYAMAIGDAFTLAELSPWEWAQFAEQCNLPKALVGRTLKQLSTKVRDLAPGVADEVVREGAQAQIVKAVLDSVIAACEEQLRWAPKIAVKLD